MKKKESVCCNSSYRVETWISKTKRKIYYCCACGEPCKIRKKKR